MGGDNIPPAQSPIHEAIRRLPAVQEQFVRFLGSAGAVSLRKVD